MPYAAALVRQRALAHESRVAILEALRDAGQPQDAGGIAERAAPFAQVTAEEAWARLVELLDDLAFSPRSGAGPDEIELRHCPFRELDELIAFVDPDCCLTRVAAER